MQKLSCFLIVIFWCKIAIGKDLKPLAEYEVSLQTYYQSAWKANREEFKDLHRKAFWDYVPDVGFGFGLPIVSWRLSDIWQYKRDKHLLERKLKSLDMKMELEMNKELQQLGITYSALLLELERIKIANEKHKLEEAIYSIGVECCEKRACTPEECRTKDLERFESTEKIRLMKIEFDIKVLELEKMAYFGLKITHFKP